MIDEASNQNDQNYLKSLHLLYVEDEDDDRTQMVDFLQRRVKKVYAAVNGVQGLELFGQYDINLVITDIRMPLMDGLAMAEHIRAMSPKIPIIITTAFEDTRYFTRAIDLSVDKYIVKPIDINILNNTFKIKSNSLIIIVSYATIIKTTTFHRITPTAIVCNNALITVSRFWKFCGHKANYII